jgi:hypothetical protein
MLLERAGYSIEAALPAALAKDGDCTPAALAWLLSEVKIPDGIELPAGVAPAELRTYLAELIRRLLVLAAPRGARAALSSSAVLRGTPRCGAVHGARRRTMGLPGRPRGSPRTSAVGARDSRVFRRCAGSQIR